MPLSIPDALEQHAAASAGKARAVHDLPRYLWSSALAGAYVGVAIVLLIAVSAPLVAAGSPAAKLVQASVFGVALTLVVFAGAELFTGNVMVMAQGWWQRRVRGRDVVLVGAASLAGNLLGSLLFAAAVNASGVLSGPGVDLVGKLAAGKHALAGPQLLWRAVLCNALVCLALWMAARASSDGAKLAVLWWALLAFVGSGFEHCVANMTTLALAALEGTASWGELARNLAWTVPGNILGGGVVIGLGYAWLAGTRDGAGDGGVVALDPADERLELVATAPA
jgi:nitrite transporter NirC